MRKYLRVLFQNSMRGRKERFKLSCSLFAIMALSLIAVFTLAANPVAGGVLLSGLGLMAFIDESTLDDDQKKFFKGLDDKLEELNVKFLKDELGKPEYLKQINDLINEFKQLNEKNMSDKIDKKDFENFKKEFNTASTGLFGSGWAWLSIDKQGKLHITKEPNGSNPWRAGLKPLLGFDVWEHAYYLDYQNRRADHVNKLWEIIDWDVVEKRL